jgi:hypothetical protein
MATRHVDVRGGADALNRLIAVLFDGISLAWPIPRAPTPTSCSPSSRT